MFKSLGLRCRRHTCKIVLITSVIWCLIDFFLLVTYFDCVGLECSVRKKSGPSDSSGGALSGKHDSIKFAAKQVAGDVEQQLLSGGRLVTWSPAQTVIAPPGSLPGEMGKPVNIPKSREKEKNEKFRINQFNLLASEMISLNRSLSDVRLAA